MNSIPNQKLGGKECGIFPLSVTDECTVLQYLV